MLARVNGCPYCGRPNETGVQVCRECGTELPVDSSEVVPPVAALEPVELPVPDRFALEMGFEVVEGFSRPDWTAIRSFIRTHMAERRAGADD